MASGNRIHFSVECPKCHLWPDQSFDREELSPRLQSKPVKFYCSNCDIHWDATATDVEKIAGLLRRVS